ncbi:MAG: glutathione S-transferase family protein [Parvibaculaceae bacterium]
MSLNRYTLHGRYGWGSVLTEAQLEWYGLRFDFVAVGDLFEEAAARKRLAKINPLGQVPALVLPNGEVMTETAAITLHLADATESQDLVPAPGEAARPRFLRWLVFIVANIYPTFTYGDVPERFVPGDKAAKGFRANVDDYQKALWRMVESEARTPWFLGERFSALDIYLCAMTRWRPNRPWFEKNAPKLALAAERCDELPKLAAVWQRNYPPEAG